jgi:hypothetical protein
MNVGRGLFRAWILVTVLWCFGVGALAYTIVPDQLSHGKWQYVYEMRDRKDVPDWAIDWKRPLYEIMRSPSIEKLKVGFSELGYEYVQQWDKHVAEGRMMASFPDGSLLYLDKQLTQADQECLARAFWDQRWRRYAEIGKTWAAVLVGPPIALFIIGWALLWVGRGFKAARP